MGQTQTGQQVIGNVFKLTESRGVPLELIIDQLHQQNCVIDWVGFYNEARQVGWTTSTTLKKVQYALQDVFDKDYAEQVIMRLKLYIVQQEGV